MKQKQYGDAQAVADSLDLGQLDLGEEDVGTPISPAIYFFHPDHLGSSTVITDGSGYAYQIFLNLPFGETMAEQRRSGTFNNAFKFNGKELDTETGLYYYGARYYNPRISNWLSVDPIALWQPVQETEHYILGQHNGGYFNPKNMSVYGYTYQNPIRYIDPNGKQSYFAELFNDLTTVRYNYPKDGGGDIGKMAYLHKDTRTTTSIFVKEDALADYTINGLKRVLVDRYLSNKTSSKTPLPKTVQKESLALLKKGTDITITGKIKNVGKIDLSNWYGSFSVSIIDGKYSRVDFECIEPAGSMYYLTDDSILEYSIFVKGSDKPLFTIDWAKGAKEINRIFKLEFATENEINCKSPENSDSLKYYKKL